MSNPPIPRINEDNEVLGETTIKEAVAQGWPRQVVRVFIFDTAGRILLQKRSTTILSYPSLWDNAAGGHIDVGESPAESARREAKEEIGLDIELSEIISAFKHVGTEETLFVWAYKAVLPEGTDVTFRNREVQAVEWFTIEAFEQWAHEQPEAFVPAFVDFWHRWRDTILST